MYLKTSALILALVVTANCSSRGEYGTGVQAIWGLNNLRDVIAHSQNVVIPIMECRFDGFAPDLRSEYRASSALRTEPKGRIIATVPNAGTYYPGFIFYDSDGNEQIEVSLDGSRKGVAVAKTDNNRQYLFFLDQPVTFRGGEQIELLALTNTGAYRTEDILLLKEKPLPRRIDYIVDEVHAPPEIFANSVSATLTWITSWPVACKGEWRGGSNLGQHQLVEVSPTNNHRVILPDLEPQQDYQFRIVANTREEKILVTDWQSFNTHPIDPISGTSIKDSLELQIGKGTLVTTGVPFPRGALGSSEQLRLGDGVGAEMPLQVIVTARWEDGSIKWALLDTQVTSAHVVPYTLEFGTNIKRSDPKTKLEITENSSGVTVNTGPLKLRFSRENSGLFEALWFKEKELMTPEKPAAIYLTGTDGTVYDTLAPPEKLVVEENGPLRAVIRGSGKHHAPDGRTLFSYTMRVHAYAGQPYLRVQHSFGNDEGKNEFTLIKNLTMRLSLAAVGQPLWSMEGRSGKLRDGEKAELHQHTDNYYSLIPASASGRRASGWAKWSDGAHDVTLVLRNFWQNYPKDLVVSSQGIELGICPTLKKNEYAEAQGTVDEHRLYYYLQDGFYKFRQGVTKTHDIWLEVQESGSGKAATVLSQHSPFIASASAEWYAASNAFNVLAVPKQTGILGQYDTSFERSFKRYLNNRETNREYGMLNFGDWWGERGINWGNSEYDTQHAFLLQFLRKGDPRYFQAAEEMEWHNRDIDTVNYHADRSRIGGVYQHCIVHTGHYYSESPVPEKGTPSGRMSVSHAFVEGHLDYYFLTGDRSSFETAMKISDWTNGHQMRNYDFTNCRAAGWNLILTLAAYNATLDRFYLNDAKIIVARVLERQTTDGGWKRQMVGDHCYCKPKHHGNAGFMVAVLLTGRKNYHQITGDRSVADSIVRGARFVIHDMWVPEVKGFRYTSCPKSVSGGVSPSWSNFLLFDGIVYAHQLSNDPTIRRVLLEGTPGAIQEMATIGAIVVSDDGKEPAPGIVGKEFTQYTRVAPHFIGYLAQLAEEQP